MTLGTDTETTVWVEQAKLLASDGDSHDNFGTSVSINGDYAIIGAYLDEENGENSGSAYVFKRNNTSWEEEAKLTASSGPQFGISSSIDGDYAIVGTWGNNGAYIFKRDGTNWMQQTKLTGLDGNFGRSVSIDGNYTIVGSHGEDNYTGAAYIFKRDGTNWTQQARLTASDGTEIDVFGISVSVDGDYAIIGAYKAGTAYIFKRDGTNWTQQAKLTGIENSFGLCVSIDGDRALVGEDIGNDGKGAAYIFKRIGTNWIEDAKLVASDAEKSSLFGGSVSIDGEYVIVGADCDGSTGAAYTFKYNGTNWIEEAKLLASDGEDDVFGTSVSIDGENAIIGAYYDNDNGKESGSAYIFKKDQLPNTPAITGPTSGKVGIEYEYNFSLSDPDNDLMYLRVNWGNGTPIPWQGPYDSDTTVQLSHAWNQHGNFTIRVQAKDVYDVESNWSEHEVTIPRTRATSYLWFELLLERFPMLHRLLGLLL
jgi:hypothetical protein